MITDTQDSADFESQWRFALELAPNCSADQVSIWLELGNGERLANFLRARHTSRFFEPIKCLRTASDTYSGYGFSMMALCCLLTETIECYRQGLPTTSQKEWNELLAIQRNQQESIPADYQLATELPARGEAVFVKFFQDFHTLFSDVDGSEFYHNIRNGLLHQAQTKRGWTIDARGSAVCERAQKHLNRNLFAQALHEAFESYVRDLESKAWTSSEWKHTRKKIWWLVRIGR